MRHSGAACAKKDGIVVALNSSVVVPNRDGPGVLPATSTDQGFVDGVVRLAGYHQRYSAALGLKEDSPFRLRVGIMGIRDTVLGLPSNASRSTSLRTFAEDLHYAWEIHDAATVGSALVAPFLEELWGLFEADRTRFVKAAG